MVADILLEILLHPAMVHESLAKSGALVLTGKLNFYNLVLIIFFLPYLYLPHNLLG